MTLKEFETLCRDDRCIGGALLECWECSPPDGFNVPATDNTQIYTNIHTYTHIYIQ